MTKVIVNRSFVF